MRRTYAIFLAISLALTLTVPASAKPKQDPPGKPSSFEGLTCEQFFGFDDPRVVIVGDTGEASIVVDRRLKEACFDVPAGGTWTITLVDVAGALDPREVQLHLKDSMPGDDCYMKPVSGYGSWIFEMGATCDPPAGQDGWTDIDPDQQVLYVYMVGPGRAAVEVTLKRSDG
jgi:hypothetical protein